jgi:uncharacterized protein YkwD
VETLLIFSSVIMPHHLYRNFNNGDNLMRDHMKTRIVTLFVLLLVALTACAQNTESTSTPTVAPTTPPTVEPTNTPKVEPSQTPTLVPVQNTIIAGQVVVDKIMIQKLEGDSGAFEAVVQGSLSNTCTVIDEVSVSRSADVFSINLKTSFTAIDGCEEKNVQFEETVPLDTQDLTPGTYLVASGVVERFEIEAPSSEGDQGAAVTATPVVPRDCQDVAAFVSDVTYPDNSNVEAGETFTKTWAINNTGTCAWGPGYELVLVSGDFSQSTPLDDPFPVVAAKASVELSISLSVPESTGVYTGTWNIKRPEGDNVKIKEGEDLDLWAIVIVPGELAVETRVVQNGLVCAEANPAFETDILELINAARADNDLPPLTLQPQLTNAARALTNDMACNDFASNTGSDGSDWYDRIAAQGYSYSDAAENIYYGFGGVPGLAFNFWMDSEVSSDNILDPDFTQIGVAIALNPQTGATYYTVVFAVP